MRKIDMDEQNLTTPAKRILEVFFEVREAYNFDVKLSRATSENKDFVVKHFTSDYDKSMTSGPSSSEHENLKPVGSIASDGRFTTSFGKNDSEMT